MTYRKADLEAVKKQIAKTRGLPKKRPSRKVIKKEIHKNYETKKKVIEWNYKVNDIVLCPFHNNQIGLIISDNKYFGKRVEKNYFFVLLGSQVVALNGQHLKKI